MQNKTKVQLINKKYSKNLDTLFEQYKLLSEGADRITEKRQNMNNFYLAVNTLIFAIASYLATVNIETISILISVMGLITSIVWLKNIVSFRDLNSAKFKVIHELEEHLPSRVYQKEDEYLRREYYHLTSIEKFIPITFGALYLAMILISLGIKFSSF